MSLRALTEVVFYEGETIFEQGEAGGAFFILYDGAVDVIKDGQSIASLEGTRINAEIFGHDALATKLPRSATIKVTSPTAWALSMDKDSFELLLGPLTAIWQRRTQRGTGGHPTSVIGCPSNDRHRKTMKPARFLEIPQDELDSFGLLGCGAFGAVELVQHRTSKRAFALKVLSKGHIVKEKLQKTVIIEKEVMSICDSPFILKLLATYRSEQSLSFLIELATAGELFQLYLVNGFHGSERHARYYVAAVALAFEHMHEKKSIHRDLKPENVLVTEEGRAKLADMGLSKIVAGKTYTQCGTPEYMSPEVIAMKGHGRAVDWWALGVFTFELMAGHTPFEDDENHDVLAIYANVNDSIDAVRFPDIVTGSCKDLVTALLQPRPARRLPMRKGGVGNVKSHAWFEEFSGFDWAAMYNSSMVPPYKPPQRNLREMVSVCRGSGSGISRPPWVEYVDDSSGWDEGFEIPYEVGLRCDEFESNF